MLQFKGARLSLNTLGGIKVFLEGLVGFEVIFIVYQINENLHFLRFFMNSMLKMCILAKLVLV